MAGSDTSREDDELEDAKEAYEVASEAWADNYSAAVDDFEFARLHKHWPEKILRERALAGRPTLVVPKLPAFIRQVVNDARQNKPAINVRPVDSGADPETAEVFNGLIRHIEQNSDADVAYDTALDCAVTGGFGWFILNTQYTTDDSFEQEIVFETVPNPFTVTPDPNAIGADSSNWNDAFVMDTLSSRAFEERWPGEDPSSFDGAKGETKTPKLEDANVTIAARWMREKAFRKIVAVSAPRMDAPDEAVAAGMQANILPLPENQILDLNVFKANKALFEALGVKIVAGPRDVPTYKVTQRLYSGAACLEENDWAGKYIPIVPVYGVDVNVEGKRYLEGLVRPAKDEQRRFNYELSAATEASGLAPKTPFIGPVGSFATDSEKWNSANVQNWAYMEYDIVQGQPAPQRQPYAGVPVAQFQLALSASDNLKAIMGLHDASLGAQSNETSGVAIMARQREGDVSSFHYIDNLSRAIRHAGRIIIDLIPHVYSTERMIRVLGPEGDAKPVRIGPAQSQTPPPASEDSAQDQREDLSRVFDLTVGRYDLVVTAGPSFTSRREEAASQMIELIRAYPPVAPIIGDLLAKNLDWPGADEIADRLKAMLPTQLQGESPEAQAMKAQLQKLAEALGQARAQLMEAETDRSIEQGKLKVDEFNAETNRLKAITGPKGGTGFDPAEMAPVVATSLLHILQSPDILEAVNAGAPPEQIVNAIQQRMQSQQPPMAA